MLEARTCPFTGVVNIYRSTEPHLPVGTIVVGTGSIDGEVAFHWWCHTAQGGQVHGIARDMRTAQTSVARIGASALVQTVH